MHGLVSKKPAIIAPNTKSTETKGGHDVSASALEKTKVLHRVLKEEELQKKGKK
jgi:hypothetical protein